MFSYTLVIILKIVCFVISYKIVKLGYLLVKAGVMGEFKFSSNLLGFKADLASVSPGLLFVLLGVMFMMVAIYVNKTITYERGGVPVSDTSSRVDNYPPAAVPDSSDFPSFPKPDQSKKP